MEKKKQRRQALLARDSLGVEERLSLSGSIAQQLYRWEFFRRAHRILSYASFRSEVDTDRINKEILRAGKELYLPKTDPDRHEMVFYRVHHPDELAEGYRGIREPQGGEPFPPDGGQGSQEPSLMIMPGAAFDEYGNRLGYGGGYYDRYLAAHGTEITNTCMLAFEIQGTERIETEKYDVRPDWIVTDRMRRRRVRMEVNYERADEIISGVGRTGKESVTLPEPAWCPEEE